MSSLPSFDQGDSRWFGRTVSIAVLAMVGLLSAGCRGDNRSGAGGGDRGSEVEQWSLSEAPLLEIGVVEGDPAYQLHEAVSSVRLPGAEIAVVNAGSQEIRFYAPDGRHVRSAGGTGDGPTEFRRPARIWRWGADSLRVWDGRLRRFTFMDMEGNVARTERLEPGDDPFPLDVWVHAKNWVDSPLAPSQRSLVLQTLAQMPEVSPDVAIRFVKVTPAGRVWTTNALPPADTVLAWSVYEMDGTLLARVSTPPRFDPHEVGHDFVLGRATDPLDVNYVRQYAIQKPDQSPVGRGLAAYTSGAVAVPEQQEIPDEVRSVITSLMKNMASAQEIYYSSKFSYSSDISQLEIELPDEVQVTFIKAGPTGWTGFFHHADTGGSCVLTYGAGAPIGWVSGAIICA